MLSKRRSVQLSQEIYDEVKQYGFAGESINDALARVLKNASVGKSIAAAEASAAAADSGVDNK